MKQKTFFILTVLTFVALFTPLLGAEIENSAVLQAKLALRADQPSPEINRNIYGAGRVLTAGTIQAHNTFEKPDMLQPAAFSAFKVNGDSLTVEMPSKSVVVLEIQ